MFLHWQNANNFKREKLIQNYLLFLIIIRFCVSFYINALFPYVLIRIKFMVLEENSTYYLGTILTKTKIFGLPNRYRNYNFMLT